ncbi:hypothetical protein C5C94_00405 [Rathayibacter sp. AY1C3]|nr:hypothetical protein C5B98_05705 [Rathayibacter sp. AY1A5]PPF38827.1 hypothetical protein C5C10_03995 [Rathayibacter sp. AY1A3]PPG32001.1 hypothetical protein C5C25_06940 [Rathayibacter sp. AY2B9]PPG82124.1 hypothetical protein C5C52_06665 [Rathayibacter sp. AY1E5]PPH11476.1 hypothetical protein C5C71_07135 [Rathayibacter sp. AY1C1]PPH31819.1 hypothetical protein C5C37_00400 [Rathayibacter sp. AY1F9]PPH34254.1 hypothetical protein C5C94_00405 [Rathayibacter sp. AY1C3]PPI07277.1 hypothetic
MLLLGCRSPGGMRCRRAGRRCCRCAPAMPPRYGRARTRPIRGTPGTRGRSPASTRGRVRDWSRREEAAMDDDELRHRTRDRKGARAVWFAGLSALAGFVVISPVISLTATVMVWGSRRRIGTLSDRNGLVAVNWQLTYLALQLMLVPLHLALVSVRDSLGADWPLATISAILALAVLNLVLCVVLGIRSGRGRTVRLWIAVPFARSTRPPR